MDGALDDRPSYLTIHAGVAHDNVSSEYERKTRFAD